MFLLVCLSLSFPFVYLCVSVCVSVGVCLSLYLPLIFLSACLSIISDVCRLVFLFLRLHFYVCLFLCFSVFLFMLLVLSVWHN